MLEREIPGFDHAVNGKAVSKAGDQLDSLAGEKGLPTLVSFSAYLLKSLLVSLAITVFRLEKPAPEKWFSADDGLKTLNGLIDGADEHKLDPRVIADLHEFETVLETARRNGVGWHLAVDF